MKKYHYCLLMAAIMLSPHLPALVWVTLTIVFIVVGIIQAILDN